MRRSARETRRPEFLTYQAPTSIPEDQSDSDHNSEPNEVKAKKKRERSSAKKEESGEGEEESDFEENEPKAKRPTKKAKKAATNTKEKNAEEEGKVRDISLFDSVLTFAGKDFSSLCNGWLEKHQESPVQSWTELMNFVLMSAGLEKDSIHPDTDLDALNPEEIENMLAKTLEMTQRGAKSYPLNEKPKNKSSVPYRTKYQSFWQCLAQKLFELKDHLPSSSAGSAKSRRSTNTVKSNRGVELMNQLVDYLASFSSLPSVNVRDAVAEAALSLAEGAIPLANQLKEATITADRQLHQSSSTSLKNPKSKAFAEQKEEYSHNLNLWSEVISSVFNTIYISRSKDFNEDVRLVCVRHLEQLIRFDVSRPVKTEYLKYLGWACYDHAHAIRFEAVRAINNLIQDDAIIGSLVNFVLHFMDRFIEIASCDIDADVSLEMISTMRVMQKQGFLDTVSEDKLDMVDVIIFDPDATSEMRREALLFLMDHTEGFDLPLEAEEEKGTQKARSKSSDKKAAKNRPGEFNKNIAFQLETLTEFAEHNLTPETVDWSFLLAEACLETDKAPILYDWNTAISLLTKDFEDEELIAKPLRDIQIAILLQLMLTAAKQVNSQRKQLEEHGLMKGNSREKELVNHRWESLNQSLGSKLSSLLTRFKDNDKNLAALTELLSCCEISTTMKSSQTLIKSIKDIFLTFNSESLLRNILLALRRWKVDDVFDNLFNLSVASFQTNSVEFEKRETNEAEDHRKNQEKNHRRRSSSTNRGDVTERRDALLDSIHKLGGDMMRLRLLFENVDCRQFLRKDSEKNLIIQIEEVASHLIETLKKAEEDFSLIQRTDLEVLNQLAHDLLFGIFALVLWKYNDVMNLGDVMELSETRRQSRIKANGSSKESQSEGDQLALEDVLDQKDISLLNSKIEDLLEVREKLVEMSLSYMKYLKFVSEAVNSSDEEISVAEAFAISGFRMISYLRSYFPLRQNKYLGVDRLLFQPSSEALGLLKFVFDNISQRINEQLDQLEVDNEATTDQNGQEKKLSRVLIEQLLLPLSGSFVYDTENFNRRQTAAVLLFILHRNPSVVEAVKTIAKKLRDKELVAYLEAQFVALKSCFTEEVLRPLSLKQQAENAEDDVDFDFADNETSIQSGYERLIAYSRKFSSLLGVGKLKESALEAVEAFLRLAVEFTFTDALHVGFCEALAPFLRFLPANQKKELHQFLLNELETNEKYSNLLSEFTRQKAVPDVEFQRFFLFLEQLSTGQAAGMPSKQSKRKLSSSQIHSTTEPRDQEVPKVAAKPSMASQTPTKKGSTSKNKSSRMSKISNVTLSPIRETRRSSRNAGKKVKYNEDEEDEDGIEEFDDDEEEEEVFASQKAKTSQKTKRDQVPATPTSLNSFATGLDIEDYEDVEESPRPRGSQRRNNSSSNKRSREELADTNFIPSELLMLDTSPIQLSGIEDLENVPRRRKLLS